MTTVEHEFPPIVAGWLRSWSEFTDTAYGVIRRLAHRSGYHGLRVPLYLARLALMSPRGLYRAARGVVRVVFDTEARPLRLNHIDRLESKEFIALERLRRDKVKNRLIVAGVLSVPVMVGAVVAYFMLPSWSMWAAVGLIVEVLGWVGRPLDKPIAKPATVVPGAPGPLRAPHVTKALCSLGIGAMRNPEDVGLLMDVARIRGGYQIDLELPQGVAANSVIERRSQLSAALRRELGCVWPATGPRHEGHLQLIVRDEPMAKSKQPTWPLLKAGAVDVFKPAPLATDQQDQWVPITLAYTSGAIGAVPRVGKTYYLREIGLLAALDPRCRLYVIDLKGTGDLSPLSLVSHFYSVGDEPEALDEQLAALRELRDEMRRRAKVIRELPREICPENKTTSVLADRKDLGLEPVWVGIDECQAAFENEDSKVAKEYVSIVTDLVKRGPAMGIMVFLATQKPDAKSIPTAIADNLVVRIALKMSGQPSNDQILGTSSYQAGQRATLFSFDEKGLALLKADGSECQVVRSVSGLDAVVSERVATRARHARQSAGRLTGMAAGELMQREQEQAELLDDLRQVISSDAVHLADLVALLASHRPGIYGHLDTNALGGMLRSVGVVPGTVWDGSKTRSEAAQKGIQRVWLDRVAATSAIGSAAEEKAFGSVSS